RGCCPRRARTAGKCCYFPLLPFRFPARACSSLRHHPPCARSDVRTDRWRASLCRGTGAPRFRAARRARSRGAGMKAIIYAAGRGTRLQSDSPKILLEFGGRTLLEWHVLRLHEAGVREVVLVTSDLRELSAELLPMSLARYGVAVSAVLKVLF